MNVRVIRDSFTHLGKAAIGQTKQILTNASLTSVLNVSALGVTKGIIKGAVKGAIISLILEPLYGQTTPKYYDWSQAVEKNSELLLNPQWMNEAGVGVSAPFTQWETHCRALKQYKTNISYKLISYKLISYKLKSYKLKCIYYKTTI